MEAMLTQVAGVDVHKETLAITVLIGDAETTPTAKFFTCTTMTDDLQIMGETLLKMGVKHVAMESTGIYWKPVHNVWSKQGLCITLGNATHMKNVPGRKTDMKDSHWIAQLHRMGLIQKSYVPEAEFQELRALTRHRQNLVGDINRIKNRVHKILEDGNVKLASVVSDVFGVSGIAVLDALATGTTDKKRLAALVTTNVKASKEQIERSLANTMSKNQCFVLRQLMLQYMDVKQRVYEVEKEIEERMTKYAALIEKLIEVPGVSTTLAQVIISEATTEMDNFRDDRRFAAWAGVAPGNNESGGKKNGQNPGMATQPSNGH